MKRFYANGRSMAQILGWIKPRIGEGEQELSTGGFLGCARNDEQSVGDVPFNRQMPNRVRHDEKGVEQGISTGGCFDYAQHDMQGVREVQVQETIPNSSNTRTSASNVANVASAPTVPHLALMPAYAVVGRGMQEGRDVVASRHSDTLLGTFGKTKVPCPSGIEDGKDEGRGKEVELSSRGSSRRCAPHDDGEKGGKVLFNIQIPNRVRHDVETTQTNTSFIPYITSVSKQFLQPMAHGLRLTTLLIFVSCLLNSALAQSRPSVGAAEGQDAIVPIRVGDKVPLDFWTREHLFYRDGDTIRMTLQHLRRKPFILDFWATWCGACIQRFPDNERMQKALRDRMPFILVNSDHKYDNLEKIAGVLNDTSHFAGNKGGSIIFDSYLKQLFPHRAIPHYVWIDHTDRVRAITVFDFVSTEQMRTIIHRRKSERNND